jgi:hypothetical protein
MPNVTLTFLVCDVLSFRVAFCLKALLLPISEVSSMQFGRRLGVALMLSPEFW